MWYFDQIVEDFIGLADIARFVCLLLLLVAVGFGIALVVVP